MFIQDFMRFGVLPVQHAGYDQQDFLLETRCQTLVMRIQGRQTGRGQLGHWVYDPDADVGDLTGVALWQRNKDDEDNTRDRAAARTSWPVVVAAAPDLTDAHQFGSGRLACQVAFDAGWSPDKRLGANRVSPHPGMPDLPAGTVGLVVSAQDEREQIDLLLSADPRLIAAHDGGRVDASSRVHDLEDVPPNGKISDTLRGPLSDVVRAFTNRLALNFTAPGRGGLGGEAQVGFGSAYSQGDGGPTGQSVVPGEQPDTGIIEQLSWEVGGPIHPGHVEDRHILGETSDGTPINSAHIWTEALFYRDQERDGPLEFRDEPWLQGVIWPWISRPQIRWDAGSQQWRLWDTVPLGAPRPPIDVPRWPLAPPIDVPRPIERLVGDPTDGPGGLGIPGDPAGPGGTGAGAPAGPASRREQRQQAREERWQRWQREQEERRERRRQSQQERRERINRGHEERRQQQQEAGVGDGPAPGQPTRTTPGQPIAPARLPFEMSMRSVEIEATRNPETQGYDGRYGGMPSSDMADPEIPVSGRPDPINHPILPNPIMPVVTSPLAVSMVGRASTYADGEWDLACPGSHGRGAVPGLARYLHGIPVNAALEILPGGVLPDGESTQGEWTPGSFHVILSDGTYQGGDLDRAAQLAWGSWDGLSGQAVGGPVIRPAGVHGVADLQVLFRDADGDPRNGRLYLAGGLDLAKLPANPGDAGTLYRADGTGDYLDGTLVYEGQAVIGGNLHLGALGNEQDAISVNGVNTPSRLHVGVFSGSNAADIVCHRHSTTQACRIIMGRSNSTGAAHGNVVDGMDLGVIDAAGRHSGSYQHAARIAFMVDGNPTGTRMPGRIDLMVSPADDRVPEPVLSILSDKIVDIDGVLWGTVAGTSRQWLADVGGIRTLGASDGVSTSIRGQVLRLLPGSGGTRVELSATLMKIGGSTFANNSGFQWPAPGVLEVIEGAAGTLRPETSGQALGDPTHRWNTHTAARYRARTVIDDDYTIEPGDDIVIATDGVTITLPAPEASQDQRCISIRARGSAVFVESAGGGTVDEQSQISIPSGDCMTFQAWAAEGDWVRVC